MSDTHAAKTLLYDIAAHAYNLAMGLQNAAPPQENSKPAPSIQYLLEAAIQLKQSSKHVEDLLTLNEKEQQPKLIELIRDSLEQDIKLRVKYHIAERFRFIRDRLHSLLEQLEKNLPVAPVEQQQKGTIEKDEIPVYVHLYNTEGGLLRNWQTMLTPKVFYEYSVNRPIYTKKEYIEAFLKYKPNKSQHAYLTVAIKAKDLIQQEQKDMMGSPLAKIKEGALDFKKLISFTHNDQDYLFDEKSGFVKK
jgi:hypothetical protein